MKSAAKTAAVARITRTLPDRLIACSLSACIYSSYVPLDRISRQLARAVQIGDVDRLERLWQALCDRYPDSDLHQCLIMPDPFTKKTHLVLATELKKLDIVNWLVMNGSEDGGLTKTSDDGSILHLAAASDAPDIIALYHARMRESYDDEETGVKLIDWPNAKGASPLCTACQKGSYQAVLMLLSLGASTQLEDVEGSTPLHYASAYGHLNIVTHLLNLGASAFTKNNLGYTASDVAFSHKVEQEIQNTVRSALEASKRSRKLKSSAAPPLQPLVTSAAKGQEDSELRAGPPDSPTGLDNEASDLDIFEHSFAASRAPHLPSGHASSLKLQAMGILPSDPPPPLSPLNGVFNGFPTSIRSPPSAFQPRELPTGSTSPEVEASKALQRILALDQNAQAGFQAAAAYKGLVTTNAGGSSTVPNAPSACTSMVPSTSPYSTMSKESGYFSSKAESMMRERSSSTGVSSSSFVASTTPGSSISASTSPGQPLLAPQVPRADGLPTSISVGASSLVTIPKPVAAPPLPPLRIPPLSALPQPPKSSTASSFVNRLRRSGSSTASAGSKTTSSASTVSHLFSPNDSLPREKAKEAIAGRRGLKQHASLMDLRSHAATAPPTLASSSKLLQTTSRDPPTPQKSTFSLVKSRARSGT